jgi:hypothetical protein
MTFTILAPLMLYMLTAILLLVLAEVYTFRNKRKQARRCRYAMVILALLYSTAILWL